MIKGYLQSQTLARTLSSWERSDLITLTEVWGFATENLPPGWHAIFLLMNNHSLLTFPCHETLMPECEQKMKGPVLPEDRWTLIIKLPRASNCSWQPSNWRKNLWRLIKTCQDSCCDNEERWWWSVDIITACNIMLLTPPPPLSGIQFFYIQSLSTLNYNLYRWGKSAIFLGTVWRAQLYQEQLSRKGMTWMIIIFISEKD